MLYKRKRWRWITITITISIAEGRRDLAMASEQEKNFEHNHTKSELLPFPSMPSDKQHNSVARGWKTMPLIVASEVCERMGMDGLHSNFISYLMKDYHMKQVTAATVINVITGTSSITPLLGAFLADLYLGRFRTIVGGSVFFLVGSFFLTLSAASQSLRPSSDQKYASPQQLGFLFMAFFLITLGTGGLRPCTYAFGADQFKENAQDEKQQLQQKKNLHAFFNWFFFSLFVAFLLGATVVVYIQDNVGFSWGFGVLPVSMGIALAMLLLGMPLYRHESPTGSPFTSYAQVFVAASQKRNLPLPKDPNALYHTPYETSYPTEDLLSHTNQFKHLDHAAIIEAKDLREDGRLKNPWKLCPIQHVEELKCLVRLFPIWVSSIMTAAAVSQHHTFNVPQAKTMDRHMGGSFVIPAASVHIFSGITMVIWIPIYDRVLVPLLRRLTGHHRGIKLLQRIGFGIFLCVLYLLTASLVESKRRGIARSHGFISHPKDAIPMSVFWLVPQYILSGLSTAFRHVGELELLHDQLPSNLHSTAGALFWVSIGLGQYVGGGLLQVLDRATKTSSGQGWLEDNINKGHLDYLYYTLASLEFINLIYFITIAHWYNYRKPASSMGHEEKSSFLEKNANV